WGLMTGGCGIGIPRCCRAPAVFAIPPRMPGSCCARAAVHGRHSVAIEAVRTRRFHMILTPSQITSGSRLVQSADDSTGTPLHSAIGYLSIGLGIRCVHDLKMLPYTI